MTLANSGMISDVQFVVAAQNLRRRTTAGKVGHEDWCRRVESDDVEHSAVLRIRNGETVGDHADDDELCLRLAHLAAILLQGLYRLNIASPSFAVGQHVEGVDVQLVLQSVDHGQRAIGTAKRQAARLPIN